MEEKMKEWEDRNGRERRESGRLGKRTQEWKWAGRKVGGGGVEVEGERNMIESMAGISTCSTSIFPLF